MPRLQLQQPVLSAAAVIAQTEEDKLKQQYAIDAGIIILFSGEFSKLQFFC
jgi:hypothetical protein